MSRCLLLLKLCYAMQCTNYLSSTVCVSTVDCFLFPVYLFTIYLLHHSFLSPNPMDTLHQPAMKCAGNLFQNSAAVQIWCALQLLMVIVKTGFSSLLSSPCSAHPESKIARHEMQCAMPTAKSANYQPFLGKSNQNVKQPQNEKATVLNKIQRKQHFLKLMAV